MSETYTNPLATRYASPEMSALWGEKRRIRLWREAWIVLATVQQRLGLPIGDDQIAEMKSTADHIDLAAAASYEKSLRHDVMAHVHTWGDLCPKARGIIHWGATSCFVTDNADLMLIRDALRLIRNRLMRCIVAISDFAQQHASLPALAYTHYQPAQPTTVGKRATLWGYDLALDLQEIDSRLSRLLARSTKGTTGTQASFLQIFDGDHDKVRQLEQEVAHELGFSGAYAVTGQTYPRKVDAQVLDALSGIGQSLHKIATDLRLLAHEKEIEEPFEKNQIGSSAMAYKRNPMRCERVCSLTRFVMSLQSSPAMTAATQWLERTLDDSANRRLVIPQAFLAIDAALMLMQNVFSGLVVYPKTIAANLAAELPFMATESILMAAVAAGGDRQHLHEVIRVRSHEAAAVVKAEGLPNDLLERLAAEPDFAQLDLPALTDPSHFIGRAAEQVSEFEEEIVSPIREELMNVADVSVDIRV